MLSFVSSRASSRTKHARVVIFKPRAKHAQIIMHAFVKNPNLNPEHVEMLARLHNWEPFIDPHVDDSLKRMFMKEKQTTEVIGVSTLQGACLDSTARLRVARRWTSVAGQ